MTRIILAGTIGISLFAATIVGSLLIESAEANHGGALGLCESGTVWDPFSEPPACVPPGECTSGLVLDGHCASPGTPPPTVCEDICRQQFEQDIRACGKDVECRLEAEKRFNECILACQEPPKEPLTFVEQETILLNGNLKSQDFLLLMDVTPFNAINGHVAMKVPCDKDSATSLVILAGTAKADSEGDTSLGILGMVLVSDVSNPGGTCVYHGDLVLSNVSAEVAGDNPGGAVPEITDIALFNSHPNKVESFKHNDVESSVTILVVATEASG